jgi:hypothetical protein
MLTGRKKPQLTILDRHTKGMYRCIHPDTNITCRGFGGVLRPQRGARGAAPARMNALKTSRSTERERRSPLAERESTLKWGARGAEPARTNILPNVKHRGARGAAPARRTRKYTPTGSARGGARPRPHSKLDRLRVRAPDAVELRLQLPRAGTATINGWVVQGKEHANYSRCDDKLTG